MARSQQKMDSAETETQESIPSSGPSFPAGSYDHHDLAARLDDVEQAPEAKRDQLLSEAFEQANQTPLPSAFQEESAPPEPPAEAAAEPPVEIKSGNKPPEPPAELGEDL